MSELVALTSAEARLYVRDWGSLVFSFLFPPMMMLILAGVFAADSGPGSPFGGFSGDDYYVVSYVAVPIASIALTGLPVMLAGYRELGVLKRFGASGVRPLPVIAAQGLVCLLSVLLGAVAVLLVAAPVYGVQAPQDPAAVAVLLLLGTAMMLSLGIALGLAATSVRVANAVGLSSFFPLFILGGGGPPTGVMPSGMQHLSEWLPFTPVVHGLRQAWLGGVLPGEDLVRIAGWLVVGTLLVALFARRRSQR
ncbi:MAG: ABC transporter permease [Marmoricola sp.]